MYNFLISIYLFLICFLFHYYVLVFLHIKVRIHIISSSAVYFTQFKSIFSFTGLFYIKHFFKDLDLVPLPYFVCSRTVNGLLIVLISLSYLKNIYNF